MVVRIPAAAWPYLELWFEEKVAEGESQANFVLRLMLERALVYREQLLLDDYKQTIHNTQEQEEVDFRVGVNTTRASLTATVSDEALAEHVRVEPTGGPV